MYANQSRDYFNPGTDLTAHAAASVTGATFATLAGEMNDGHVSIKTATNGGHTCGVVKYDADADQLVGIARGSSRVVAVTAGAELTAGTPVQVGDNGMAIPAADGVVVGWCVDNTPANEHAPISLAH